MFTQFIWEIERGLQPLTQQDFKNSLLESFQEGFNLLKLNFSHQRRYMKNTLLGSVPRMQSH